MSLFSFISPTFSSLPFPVQYENWYYIQTVLVLCWFECLTHYAVYDFMSCSCERMNACCVYVKSMWSVLWYKISTQRHTQTIVFYLFFHSFKSNEMHFYRVYTKKVVVESKFYIERVKERGICASINDSNTKNNEQMNSWCSYSHKHECMCFVSCVFVVIDVVIKMHINVRMGKQSIWHKFEKALSMLQVNL